jgi:hypothetical protein
MELILVTVALKVFGKLDGDKNVVQYLVEIIFVLKINVRKLKFIILTSMKTKM